MEAVSRYLTPGGPVLAKRSFHDRNIGTCGLCLVRSTAFHRVRGYDEAFDGWGPEDSDFYVRVGRAGTIVSFPVWLYPATIGHSDMLRTRFYNEKNLGRSAAEGGRRMTWSDRLVNPLGYGRAQVLAGLPGGGRLPLRVAEPAREPCDSYGAKGRDAPARD